MAPIGDAVYATLLMNDAYLPGAMVMGHSLKDRGSKAPLVAFITPDKLSQETISELRTIYDDVVPVQNITNRTPANLYLMNRPDLVSTFTKIELWRQTQFRRIVYLDADTVVLRAPNELLKLDTDFAAVPDIGWPDCFNSGMMVLNPNMGDYFALLALAQRGISFDGADQGLLNMHFTEWERLSFTYNCTPSGNYQYVPAYRHFQSSINIIHFIGRDKPWTLGRENRYNSGVYGELLARWWAVYDRHYRSQRASYYAPQQSFSGPKKVQDYVAGEEAIHAPGYSSSQPQQRLQQEQQQEQQQQQQQQFIPPPTVVIQPPSSSATEGSPPKTSEAPMGDAPSPAQQVLQQDFKPTPTVQQRRFSAPKIEWNPASAPPPVNSKPEASNFPTTQYEMSSDRHFFQPPSRYPEAPKDMWYVVPEKVPEPAKPKPIFPWESRAPKPTRVFPRTRTPTPPPEPEPEPIEEAYNEERGNSISATTDMTEPSDQSIDTPSMASPDPWAGFQARSNAWDDMPEIDRYVQAFHNARKGKIQVLHHTPSEQSDVATATDRRPSMKITDFPTEVERPSLPVTPAPIRRPSFWGEERDQVGDLPTAEGVPKQEEWNPVAKLEALQRRQSEVANSPTALEAPQAIPTRKMPESASKEAVVRAAEESISPTARPKAPVPKSILKEPRFELAQDDPKPSSNAAEEEDNIAPHSTMFNPITMVGEAASESKSESTSTSTSTSSTITALNA